MNSEDVEIRCRSCGDPIASANATVRASSTGAGSRIIAQAIWVLKRLQCGPCAVKGASGGKR